MKNLKRALSFALASVMVIGMMVIGAGAADFTDADKIVNVDAVNTLVALNVISGKEDGSYFDPTATVTRGEMAKMITVALNGGKEPVIGTKATPTYTDIKGHWAEAYIEYCSNLGIIAGRGDGTFAPNDTVTGTEAAKMMLVAMGWDSTIFNFTGASWAINVNTEANKVDLYDELENIDPNAGLSRDNAAQLIYNGILADTMQKSPSMSVTNGNITWDYYLSGTSLFEEKFNGQIWVGTMTGNDKTISSLDDDTIVVYGKLDDAESGTKNVAAKVPSTLSIENIGEEVKVLFKDAKGGTSYQPDSKDTIYGVFNTGATEVIKATQNDVKDNKEAKAKIKIGDNKYDLAETVTVITNYAVTVEYTGAELKGDKAADANSALTDALKSQNGNTIKAVCNSDSEITTIYLTTSKLAVVTAKNAEKVTLNNSVGTLKIADNDIYADIAKDDVVVVTTLYAAKATDDDAYSIVTKAEVVSGEATGYKDQTNVKLDGTTYKIANKADMLTAGIDDSIKAFGDNQIGEDFDLYLVNGFVAAAAQTSESASNYSMVIANNGDNKTAGSTFNPLKLQVIDAEGNKTVITVSDDSDLTTGSDYKAGDIITYTGDADDAVVTIKNAKTGSFNYVKKTKAVAGKVTTSEAVLFAETSSKKIGDDGAKYKVYTIRSLDDLSGITAYVTNGDGKVVAAVAELDGTASGATDETVYGIVTGYNGKVEIDDDYYYEYSVESNEDAYTLYVSTKALAAGKYVSFEPSADETYTAADITVVTTTKIWVDEYNEADGTLTYFTGVKDDNGVYVGTGSTTLALDDDCVIIYVDADEGEAGAEIGVNGFDTVTGYANGIVVLNTAGDEIVAIFVETSGECDIIK